MSPSVFDSSLTRGPTSQYLCASGVAMGATHGLTNVPLPESKKHFKKMVGYE